MTKKPDLIAEVTELLSARRDIRILAIAEPEASGPRIIGVQLRRVWEKFTYTASVFSQHEKERWHYYGQAFVIEEAVETKKGLCAEQVDLAAALGAVGAEVILATTPGYVLAKLGPEPANWDDYARRAEK